MIKRRFSDISRAVALATSSIVVLAATLPAQDVADRRFVVAVLATLAKATNAEQVPIPSDCAPHTGAVVQLCQGLIATRIAEFTTSRIAATRARDLLEQVVVDQPTWPTAWYGLGVARIQAARAGVSPHEGPLQPEGISNATGAESAFIRALEMDSTFVLAAEALALASIRTDSTSRLSDRVTILRWVRKLLPPPALFGAAMVERAAHHPDSAVAIWRILLQRGGVDRGLVELEIARDLYAIGKPDEGRTHLLAGASDTAALSQKAYRGELDLVASWDELAQWDATPVPRRSAWLRDFWALRDVREGQADNARLTEHYARLENVFVEFRYTFPATERLQAEQLRRKPCASRACPEHTTITTVIDYHTEEVAAALGAKRPFQAFTSTEDRLDDRGLVYIRQGMPLAAMRTSDDGGFELWKYERPGSPLFVSFSPHLLPARARYIAPYDVREVIALGDLPGKSAPAMLIPTMARPHGGGTLYGYLQAGFCAMKESLCTSLPDSGFMPSPRLECSVAASEFHFNWRKTLDNINLAAMYGVDVGGMLYGHEREEGFWIDSVATTTDAYLIPFTRLISPSIEMHALNLASGGPPRLVIGFAIPATELADARTHSGVAADGHTVRFHLTAYNVAEGRRIDVDTVSQFGPSRLLKRGEYLTGVVEVPLPPGTYTTSMVFTQDDSSGAIVHRDNVVMPGEENALRVSDLIFSRTGSDIHWNSGATTVALNPLATYSKGGDAQVYFQVAGMEQGKSYQSTLEFYGMRDSARAVPRLSITFAQAATAEHIEGLRDLGLKSLAVGTYRVRLVIRGAGQTASGAGCMSIVK